MRPVFLSTFLCVSLLLLAREHNCQGRGREGMTMSEEKRLIKVLLDNYKRVGKLGRPVLNDNETFNVNFGLALVQILDLDEKNQVLTTNMWNRYRWQDKLLTWDPKEYGNVDHVRVPNDKVWTPDIKLYNYADDRLKEQREALLVVSHDGTVMWIPPSIFKSTCSIDISNFPFDEQECKMKFGSWTYDGSKLDLNFFDKLEEVDVTDYVPSNEWALLAHPAKKHVIYYPCCKEPFIDLTFRVKLKRIAAFYSYILILPCVLLSSLTLVIFWLPPESPAKMVLGMNIFVAFFLLLLLLANYTPPAASSVPLIGAYFCLNMILITLSTFLSVIVINLYFRGDKRNRVPKLVKKVVINGLAKALCMRNDFPLPKESSDPERHSHAHGGHAIKQDSSSNETHSCRHRDRKKIKCPELKYNKFQSPPAVFDYRDGSSGGRNFTGQTADKSPLHNQALESDIREIRRVMRSFLNRLAEKDNLNKIAMEWRLVALVLDRIFFFMYLTTIIVSLGTIFPKP